MSVSSGTIQGLRSFFRGLSGRWGGGSDGGSSSGGGGGSSSTSSALKAGSKKDLFQVASAHAISRQLAGENFLITYQVEGYNALRYDFYWNDFSGGGDLQQVEVSDGPIPNLTAKNLSDLRYSRTAALPPLVTEDTTSGKLMGSPLMLYSATVSESDAKTLVAGGGTTANQALFRLDTGVTALTYTPTSNVSCLAAGPVGNTLVERLIVGRDSDVGQVLSNLDGTPNVDGSMHANTEPLFGAILSPLNSVTPGYQTWLLLCNEGISTLGTEVAIGTAPTQVLDGIPNGGYAMGIGQQDGDATRAFWAAPRASSATAGTHPLRIFTTNLEGTDDKDVPFDFEVKHALLWRGSPVATDGRQIKWHNGSLIDLGWNRERDWTITGIIEGLEVDGDRLYAVVNDIVGNAGNQVGTRIREEYNAEDNSWHPLSKVSTAATTLGTYVRHAGQTPVYRPYGGFSHSGRMFWYAGNDGGLVSADYRWCSIPVHPTTVNPFYNQAEDTFVTYGFDTTGYLITPVYHFYPGLPKNVTDIDYSGQLKGEDSSVKYEIGVIDHSEIRFDGDTMTSGVAAKTMSATFKEDDRQDTHHWVNGSPDNVFDRLQVKATITQGTSGSHVTKTSPNAVPFRVGGYIFLDGQYVAPWEIEPWRNWGRD